MKISEAMIMSGLCVRQQAMIGRTYKAALPDADGHMRDPERIHMTADMHLSHGNSMSQEDHSQW